jgi:LacI family transcriptional regulator
MPREHDRPTLTSIARRLGVSTATVSLALNGQPRVAAATRARVQALAERLHYTPDFLARGLVTRRTGVIGLVIADLGNSYFARLARKVEDAVRARGFDLILASTDEDPAAEDRVLRMMLQRRVDGVVLTSTASSTHRLRRLGLPLVLLGRVPAGVRADAVAVDNEAGGYLATRHLLERGHRRIAIVTGPASLSDVRGRFDGYAAALRERGIAVDKRLVVAGRFTEESGRAAMHRLVRHRPSAAFVCHNQMLIGALRAARELGLRVPRDLALVGFDEVEWADLVDPPMTMVEQPTQALAAKAVNLLVDRIHGARGRAARLLVEPVFRVRASSGADEHGPRADAQGEES